MTKKDDIIPITKREWISMMYRPKKIECDIDTARELAKVFGDKIYKDITITKKEVKDREK